MLRGAMQRDRVASSYLFAGEDGIGKRLAAFEFVKALNCLKPLSGPEGPDSCGSCPACRKYDAGTHPDFVLIEPEGAMIKVEHIRQLEETLSLRALEARYKAAIVDNAELMNESAANAFLKTLEEPAPGTVIILVSSRPDRLPQTIRSRCSRISFTPLSPEDCGQVIGKAAEKTPALTRLCMGRPGMAVREDILKEREKFFKALSAILAGGEKPTWGDRQDMERWLDQAMLVLRDLAVLKATESADGLINTDIARDLQSLGAAAKLEGIIEAYNTLKTLKGSLIFNLNKGITWNYTGSVLEAAGLHD
jgi:DNA polymerase-3 subunit delta'